MSRRTMLIFWAAVAVAVVLLGSSVAGFRTLLNGGDAGTAMLLVVSMGGLSVALLVAGRIALIAGRMRRSDRRG